MIALWRGARARRRASASAQSAPASSSTVEMHPFNGVADFAAVRAAVAARARAACLVRRAVPAATRLRAAGADAADRLVDPALRPGGRRADLEAAAGLPLRLGATTSFRPPTSGRAPTGCAAPGGRRRRDDGLPQRAATSGWSSEVAHRAQALGCRDPPRRRGAGPRLRFGATAFGRASRRRASCAST